MTFKKGNKRGVMPGTVSEVASIRDTPPDALEKLLKENAELRSQLGVAEAARGAAEKAALEAAQAQGSMSLLQNAVEEVPTGKTIKVKRLDRMEVKGHHDDGREILRPVFKQVDMPTFFYKIDMPPCGGDFLRINGDQFFHGTVYKLDLDTLRTIKEMVFRLWDHDRNVHGSNENAYRRKNVNTNPRNTLSARGM